MNQTHQGTSIIKLIKENLEIATRPKQKHMIYKNKNHPFLCMTKLEPDVTILKNRYQTPKVASLKPLY